MRKLNLENGPTFIDPDSQFTLDVSGMDLPPAKVAELTEPGAGESAGRLELAHREMQRIEAGEIKNPDEARKVTHFTDRLAYPESEVCRAVERLAAEVAADPNVEYAVVNGIGGSALGPQLLQFAINGPYWNELSSRQRRGFPKLYFLDNTDPAGIADLKAAIDLRKTVVVTISKSGGTQETRNNMIALEQAFEAVGLNFAAAAVAITMPGSQLDRYAKAANWRQILPLADSIGGRTSETNVVGHLPAALGGIDFRRFLAGACAMDRLTRNPELADNPAYQLAVAWHVCGNGRGDRNLVVVPYADRLVLLGKYLQQLIMESLGKELDRSGRTVHQGLTVYGNKGGTDAHAYIQQLNDGRDDFFVTFIETLRDAEAIEIENGLTMGDYLHAFRQGLRNALREKRRKVIDIQLPEVSEFYLGMLIALYERAVACYAELIDINAFHQPGVQAYKLASGKINQLFEKLQTWAETLPRDFVGTAAEVAAALGAPRQAAEIGGWLDKLAVNGRDLADRKVNRNHAAGAWRYRIGR